MSVKVAYYAEATLVGVVPPTVFVPRPKVESMLVRLRRRSSPPVSVPSESELFTLVRGGFAQRRKMLRRALRPVLGDRADDVLDRRRCRADRARRGRSGSKSGPRSPGSAAAA